MRITIKETTFDTILNDMKILKKVDIVNELEVAKKKADDSKTTKLKTSVIATSKKIAEDNEKKVNKAVETLKNDNKKITQVAIVKITGLSRQTISKYLK